MFLFYQFNDSLGDKVKKQVIESCFFMKDFNMLTKIKIQKMHYGKGKKILYLHYGKGKKIKNGTFNKYLS